MKYLIDTNVLLWSMENNPELTPKAKEAIRNIRNDIFVSIVSIWEVSIKMSIGKLELSRSLDEIIYEMDYLGFTTLPISLDALRKVRSMPFHHKDPFDRLIIAQAQTEQIPVITKDQKFNLYEVEVLW